MRYNTAKLILALTVTSFLCSCAASVGGSGTTTKGIPLVAEASRVEGDLENITVRIQSPTGLDCSGTYAKSAYKGSTVSFLLSCRDGRKGNALLTKSVDTKRAEVAFSLRDGTAGSVKLGGL
jgi:hypothetical protein